MLGPPRAVERAPGPFRPRVVVARRRAAGDRRLPFGVVTAPGQRYHPAVIAQAIATLAEMFPGRFWAALGSGEALNEHVTGDRWPRKADRDERLLECVEVIRALLRGEEVTTTGSYGSTEHGSGACPKLRRRWSARPSRRRRPRTRRHVGGRADHDRAARSTSSCASSTRSGKAAARTSRCYLQVHLSWAEDEATALGDRPRPVAVRTSSASELAWDLELPGQFDDAARFVRPEDVCRQRAGLRRSEPPRRVAARARRAGPRRDLPPPRR